MEGSFTYPSLFTDTYGKVTVQARYNLTFSLIVPVDMPDTDVAEGVYQGMNLLASTLVKQSAEAGYAPT
jgi:hypothetical protein